MKSVQQLKIELAEAEKRESRLKTECDVVMV